MKVTQIDKVQKPHDGAINRAAFALGKQAHEVRSRVDWELKTRQIGKSDIGKQYLRELIKLGMSHDGI